MSKKILILSLALTIGILTSGCGYKIVKNDGKIEEIEKIIEEDETTKAFAKKESSTSIGVTNKQIKSVSSEKFKGFTSAVEKARQKGFDDTKINDFLSTKDDGIKKMIQSARQKGFDDSKIINFLAIKFSGVKNLQIPSVPQEENKQTISTKEITPKEKNEKTKEIFEIPKINNQQDTPQEQQKESKNNKEELDFDIDISSLSYDLPQHTKMCLPSVGQVCSISDGCLKIKPAVFVLYDENNDKIYRCDNKPCDEYDVNIQNSGIYTNITPITPNASMWKISTVPLGGILEDEYNKYFEVVSSMLGVVISHGKCTDIN